jgi:hypothetical protein
MDVIGYERKRFELRYTNKRFIIVIGRIPAIYGIVVYTLPEFHVLEKT